MNVVVFLTECGLKVSSVQLQHSDVYCTACASETTKWEGVRLWSGAEPYVYGLHLYKRTLTFCFAVVARYSHSHIS